MLIMVVLIGGTGGTTMKTKLANTGPTGWYHLCSIKSRGVPPVPPVPPKKTKAKDSVSSRTLDPFHVGHRGMGDDMASITRRSPDIPGTDVRSIVPEVLAAGRKSKASSGGGFEPKKRLYGQGIFLARGRSS
jgi:hypothetical protein